MFSLLLLLFLLVPVVELFVVIEVWGRIGGFETIVALIGVSVVGAWLVKREGLAVWRRLNGQLAAGSLPTDELLDGALILFAGALMLTPGFFTDTFGLLLLFPPTRLLARAGLRRRLTGRLSVYTGHGMRFAQWTSRPGTDSRIVDVEGHVSDRRPGHPPLPPGGED